MHQEFLKKPQLPFDSDSVTAKAEHLEIGAVPYLCWGAVAGRVVFGRRFPVLLPSDVRLWEATGPPPQARNTVVCNRAEDTVTKVAGGDTDGDDACLSNDQRLVDLVSSIADGRERLEASITRVKEQLTPQASSRLTREQDYIQHLSRAPTADAKSFVCVLAGTAIFPAAPASDEMSSAQVDSTSKSL